MLFFSYCCQSPFPPWESQTTSPPQVALQPFADLWTSCGSNSDSNLVLLLCILAYSVHSYQNQFIFFSGSSQRPFIYSIDTESAQLIGWKSTACTSGGKVLGFLPQPCYPWVSIVVLCPPMHMDCPLGFAPEAALEELSSSL